MEYTADYSLQKLKKIAKKTLDPLRGMHSYFYILRKIFLTLDVVIADINHENYQETEDLLITLLEKNWHDYLRHIAYCYLAYGLGNNQPSLAIESALKDFHNDTSNIDIISKADKFQQSRQ